MKSINRLLPNEIQHSILFFLILTSCQKTNISGFDLLDGNWVLDETALINEDFEDSPFRNGVYFDKDSLCWFPPYDDKEAKLVLSRGDLGRDY